MKAILILASVLAAVSALPPEPRISGENGWYIPHMNGSVQWMSLKDAEQLLQLTASRDAAKNAVTFYLFTNSNPINGHLIAANEESIASSYFNKEHATRFVIHGWGGRATDSYNKKITKAWLSKGDYNIIVVEWAGAISLEYVTSVLAVPDAGAKVGHMINYLHAQHDMSLNRLDVIGHSLGSHVAGYAGKTVGAGRIHTIIGLDPALPLFSYNKPEKRLCSSDAYYVESIQTNGGTKGFLKPIGKGAFYPNGGRKQPGCGVDLDGTCSHSRSVTYYVEAVMENNFGSIKCSDYEDAVAKNCGSTYSSVRMGAMVNAYLVKGDYYVPVHSEAPFGMTG